MAATEGADAFSGSGAVGDSPTGTMAATEGADVFSGSGTVHVSGTMAAVEGADSMAATGTVAAIAAGQAAAILMSAGM
jgi:uncharacterized Zn-binding protein involved in type VI secretion